MRARQMRLRHASRHDAEQVWRVLNEISAPFGTRVGLTRGGTLELLTSG
jgi:hypothetical protein